MAKPTVCSDTQKLC